MPLLDVGESGEVSFGVASYAETVSNHGYNLPPICTPKLFIGGRLSAGANIGGSRSYCEAVLDCSWLAPLSLGASTRGVDDGVQLRSSLIPVRKLVLTSQNLVYCLYDDKERTVLTIYIWVLSHRFCIQNAL